MATPPAGKRAWSCPDCGSEVFLSITQLDPMACEACLTKMKGGSPAKTTSESSATGETGTLGGLAAQPDLIKLGMVGAIGLVVGLLLGGMMGFFAGRATAPKATTTTAVERPDDSPNESTRPGPGYIWVKPRLHKDGTYGEGYWRKDPNYKGDEESSSSKSSKSGKSSKSK